MNKKLFTGICDYLASQVPDILWIDEDTGQLESEERPPVAFPCCLIDIQYPECATGIAGSQRIRAQIQVRLAFNCCASTNSRVPEAIREKALSRLDIVESVHNALQWWAMNREINPLKRLNASTERRMDGLKVYVMTYDTQFSD